MRNQTTMRIVRTTLLGLAGLGAAGWLSASLMAGGQATDQASSTGPQRRVSHRLSFERVVTPGTACPTWRNHRVTIRCASTSHG